MTDLLDIAKDLLRLARREGATSADAVVAEGNDRSVSIRNGEIETLEQAEAREATVRVYVGQSSASMSGSVLTSRCPGTPCRPRRRHGEAGPAGPPCGPRRAIPAGHQLSLNRRLLG
jgi:hypothetical protein